jgi:PAS domain S-box-containing protein
MSAEFRRKADPAAELGELAEIRKRAIEALRRGEFDQAEKLLQRGDATLHELVENLRIYQAELEAQGAELREAQQRMAQSLHRFQRLFATLPLPALVADRGGFVSAANLEAERALGLRAGRSLQHPLLRLCEDDESRLRMQTGLEQAERHGHARLVSLRLRRADGSGFVADVHVESLPADGGGQPEFVLAIVDQTEHMLAERDLQAANAELKAHQAHNRQLSMVARRSTSLVMVADAQRRITWVNEAFSTVTGHLLAEVQGRDPATLLQGPATDARVVAYITQQVARGEGFDHVELVQHARDGRPLWVQMEMQPVRGDSGEVEQFVAILTDISERKETERALRESAENQRAVFDAEPGLVTLIRPDGVISLVNGSGARLLQAPTDQHVVGRALVDFVAPEHHAQVEQLLRKVMLGERATERFELVTCSGQRLWFEANAVPLWRNGSVAAVVAVAHDLSESRAADALRLEKEAAESASRAKTEFLSRMSHELRTPLNAVLGFAQLMQVDLERTTFEQQRGRLRQIESAGWHLLEMINDVLDLSRIETDKIDLHIEPLAPRGLIDTCLAMVQTVSTRRRITLRVEDRSGGAWVQADAMRLRQVLTNLLSNAVKYNVDGGRVEVAVDAGDAGVTLAVSNTGAGISAEHMQHLFEPFNRLGATRSGIEGTGIGLVITKRLVELMGGRIDVTSTVGAGAVFSVTLPRGAAPEPASAPAPLAELPPLQEPQPQHVRRLLYIEDVLSNIEVVREAFGNDPRWKLDLATDGVSGLRSAVLRLPDLILLDMQLPDISGMEVKRRLASDERTARIPVVVLTADALPSTRQAAASLGFAGYLVKPLNIATLHAAIGKALDPLARG